MSNKKMLKLSENRVWRIYLGGKLLDEFRFCESGTDGYFPEDWIASVVCANNPDREDKPENEGLTKTESGEYLRDYISADPQAALGKAHVEELGNNFGVLTKFLDSAERLPIQVHPDKLAAKSLFDSDYGKTEAWYILGGREINGEEPYILLGFKEDVSKEKLKGLFDKQDISGMADLMHKIPVKVGDTFLIEGGTPHAIGPGCFLLEIQEPTDYTISLEKCNTLGEKLPDFLCHQGLGFDKMFDCFHYIKRSSTEILDAFKLKSKVLYETQECSYTQIISYDRTPCFSLNRYDVKSQCELPVSNRARALVIVDGEGKIDGIDVKRGESLFVPADCQETEVVPLNGVLTFLECLPPYIGE
ncbi:MAG: class I mannose-6-phosphate isomerase [Oscillospiraceae bacterium]|nr:class I mannose-6-phosphate isomerase [Oscillospiraceae bacterium]